MQTATLAVIIRGRETFLGQKKKGEIGVGKLCGPGGKYDPGLDRDIEECVLRETSEEIGVELDPETLDLAGVLDFCVGYLPDFRVYVYRVPLPQGQEPRETADMIPAGWFPLNALPFDRMYDADRHWLPRVLRGERFNAVVHYKNRARDFIDIEYKAFNPAP